MMIGVGVLVGVAAGGALALGIYRMVVARRVDTAEARATRLVAEAEKEAETRVRQALVEVKDEISAMRREAEEDLRHRRGGGKRVEGRRPKREEALDTKWTGLSARAQRPDKLQADLARVRR